MCASFVSSQKISHLRSDFIFKTYAYVMNATNLMRLWKNFERRWMKVFFGVRLQVVKFNTKWDQVKVEFEELKKGKETLD